MTYTVIVIPYGIEQKHYLVDAETPTRARLEALRQFWQENPGLKVEYCEARRARGSKNDPAN